DPGRVPDEVSCGRDPLGPGGLSRTVPVEESDVCPPGPVRAVHDWFQAYLQPVALRLPDGPDDLLVGHGRRFVVADLGTDRGVLQRRPRDRSPRRGVVCHLADGRRRLGSGPGATYTHPAPRHAGHVLLGTVLVPHAWIIYWTWSASTTVGAATRSFMLRSTRLVANTAGSMPTSCCTVNSVCS